MVALIHSDGLVSLASATPRTWRSMVSDSFTPTASVSFSSFIAHASAVLLAG